MKSVFKGLIDFQNQMDKDSERTKKPRKTGITHILVFDVANYGPKFIAPYSNLIDKVKIMDTFWHDDQQTFIEAVKGYYDIGIETVAVGGTQFEVAQKSGVSLKDFMQILRDAGINEIEVEHHADVVSLKQMTEEVKVFKGEGFSVVGEVGKKWWHNDDTRITRDTIWVEKTVEQIQNYLDAGVDYVLWEGFVVRALIGQQLENKIGQKQFREVTSMIDPAKIIFETHDRRWQYPGPIIAWLVREFGPNVNLGNVDPWMLKRVEWIRHGMEFEMDHPYWRWLDDKTAASKWWKLEAPDYNIDVQKNYALKEPF
jgi:phosphosulfolactate synthase